MEAMGEIKCQTVYFLKSLEIAMMLLSFLNDDVKNSPLSRS